MNPGSLALLIDQLRAAGNDRHDVEVKSGVGKLPSRMMETVSAFSNMDGGTIILGLSEKDNFRPADGFKAREIHDALATRCSDALTPPARAVIEIVKFEGHQIVVAEVPGIAPSDKPCYITSQGRYGGSFVRTGDGNRKLTSYEIDRLIENKVQPLWDVEVVDSATLSDLDDDLVNALLTREKRIKARILGKMSDEQILSNLRIVAKDEGGTLRPTLAGLLALGAFPQSFFPRLTVTCALYPGTHKSTNPNTPRFVDSATLAGPIPYLVADGVAFVERNMRTGGMIDGAFRTDLYDYPPIAVREALANALMHRDYSPHSRGTQVQLNMYDDRLEMTNPGGLFGNVTISTLGSSGVSSTRNSFLSSILESTPYPDGGFVVENRGTGYQEIEARLKHDLLPPPQPNDTLTQFSLTFFRREMTVSESNAAAGLSSRDAILAHLENVHSASTRELAAAAGIGMGGTRKVLSRLIEENLVARTEPSKSPKQRYILRPSE